MDRSGQRPNSGLYAILVLIAFGWLAACGSHNNIQQETATIGTIHISADESFQPVIDSQVKVFESSFPDAKIIVDYKPEAECFRDLAKDSTRMIIVTRGLNRSEEQFYQDSLHYVPVYGILAYDAVAVIVNGQSKTNKITMGGLDSLLTGHDKENREVVMDGVSATSTVRFVLDSVLRGKALGKNVVAARSSRQVIQYIMDHENAVGFIGVSWIGDQEDSAQLAFLKKVKVLGLQCDACTDKPFVQPFQANIALKRYPLVRGLYYILKENFSGVGNNFVNFLQYERGQLIFRRAYLVPAKMSFEVRNVQMND